MCLMKVRWMDIIDIVCTVPATANRAELLDHELGGTRSISHFLILFGTVPYTLERVLLHLLI